MYFADEGVGRRVSTVFWTCIKIGISLVAGYLALDKVIVILQLLLRLRNAAGATMPRILF